MQNVVTGNGIRSNGKACLKILNLRQDTLGAKYNSMFGSLPKVLFLDTDSFLQVGPRHCRIKDSNNKSHSFVKTALLTSDTSLNLSTR